MGISEVFVDFFELAVLVVELVYFLDHPEFVVALEVEVLLEFFVLIVEPII